MDELKELKEYVRKNSFPFLFVLLMFITGRCLALITYRLQAINDQSLVLTTLLPGANKKTIDECVTAFQDSIARFQVNLPGISCSLRRILNYQESLVFRRYAVFTLLKIFLDSRRSWEISMESRRQWCRR
jgi:hypothetical protein